VLPGGRFPAYATAELKIQCREFLMPPFLYCRLELSFTYGERGCGTRCPAFRGRLANLLSAQFD
jgi:hypothetical protein